MILAIDCDLRESFGVTNAGKIHRAVDPHGVVNLAFQEHVWAPGEKFTVLFEIASPVSFNRGAAGHAAMTQLAKWAIWNVAHAAQLDDRQYARVNETAYMPLIDTFLVSPSNVWTKGYEEKARHAMCGTKLKKKDLRECAAMLFMYQHDPKAWTPFWDYLERL